MLDLKRTLAAIQAQQQECIPATATTAEAVMDAPDSDMPALNAAVASDNDLQEPLTA